MQKDHKLKPVPPDDLIVVARVARTRGLRGEVIADSLTDFPERFDNLDQVIAVAADGRQRSLQIEEHWFQRDRIVFKFAGYDSIEAAGELAGLELAVPASDRVELAADRFYEWELKDCRVESVSGEAIGSVSDVMRTGGVEILVVKNDSGDEFLIPMARDICVGIDVNQRLVRIDPPPGLLEL
jgi:16S rRNA processing protein RimM